VLDKVLKEVNFPTESRVLVDSSFSDDAGVILLNDDTALVQTTDFFTPIVDDPYLFGQIAAANALSDIYAMGAEPICALNIVCFPENLLDENAFKLILQGGADKIKEAGAVIIGGHSVSDKELKYGLAVTGIIHPNKIKINQNLHIGDKIVLTKPIGSGLLTTALKNNALTEDDIDQSIKSMKLLNKIPAQKMNKFKTHACTDVTGNGLLGHLWEMMAHNNFGVNVFVNNIPFFKKAPEFAEQSKYIPGGTLANINFFKSHIELNDFPLWYLNILLDPQTSGGLLISMPESELLAFLNSFEDYPFEIKIIAEVIEGQNKIFLK